MMAFIERLAKLAPITFWVMIFCVGSVVLVTQTATVLIVWLGHWTTAMEQTRLNIIGAVAIMQTIGGLAVIASVTGTKLAAKGPGGVSFDVSTSDNTKAP